MSGQPHGLVALLPGKEPLVSTEEAGLWCILLLLLLLLLLLHAYQPITIKILSTVMQCLFYQYEEAPSHGSGQKALILVPSCDNSDDRPGSIQGVKIINK